MPITTHIDKSKDLTIFTVKGLLVFDEVMRTAQEFYDGSPTKNVLCDLSKTRKSLLTIKQLDQIVSFQPRFEGEREPGKSAIVVQDNFISGLSNVLGTQNNMSGAAYTVMVFSSKDTAYKWLDEP